MRDCRASKWGCVRIVARWICLTYLDDARTCAGCDDRGGRADVERIVTVPAGPDDVDDKILVVVFDHGFECPRKEDLGRRCEVFRASFYAVDVRRSEEGADLRGGHDIGRKEVLEGEFEVDRGETLGRLDELFEQRFELVGCVLCHRDR